MREAGASWAGNSIAKPGMTRRIGVAGWSIPGALAGAMAGAGSHLARYAAQFDAAEINSSFHRPHRRTTYERWAASVGPGFRFAVKLPRTITHERRLVDCADLLARFAEESDGLGDRRGPTLVQLPPSFAFAADVAEPFFAELAAAVGGPIVCEPRHASWFAAEADALLVRRQVARVAADPAPVAAAADPGGWRGLAYFRLHGSPRIYRSPYAPDRIDGHADRLAALAAAGIDSWTIYDNTASGAAMGDALALRERIGA